MNYGYKNEYDFVELFNNKYVYELDNNSQVFLNDLFGEILDDSEPIKAWKNKANQKADIFVGFKNYVKGISLKCGASNSVHCEQIQNFTSYLKNLKIPYNIIDKYLSYHYGYKKDKNGKTDYSVVLSSEEYKKYYQKEIDTFNDAINKTRIIIDMIDRFIIRGRNSDYDIDVLVCGTVNDYVWINKYDLYDLILSNKRMDYTSPHIACLTIGPKKRNLNGDSNNARERYLVAVRWNFIRESIISFKNSK